MSTGPQAPAAQSHFAAMCRAEQAARGLSTQYSVRRFIGEAPAGEIAELAARRDSCYLLAAAYRAAGRRLQRRERMRARVERMVRLVTRGGIRVARSAVGR